MKGEKVAECTQSKNYLQWYPQWEQSWKLSIPMNVMLKRAIRHRNINSSWRPTRWWPRSNNGPISPTWIHLLSSVTLSECAQTRIRAFPSSISLSILYIKNEKVQASPKSKRLTQMYSISWSTVMTIEIGFGLWPYANAVYRGKHTHVIDNESQRWHWSCYRFDNWCLNNNAMLTMR